MAARERTVKPAGPVAVVGEGPFAAFLAGLLASGHGREVALVAPPPSALSVRREPALSVAPCLRPEGWRLARDTAPEATRLLARIGHRLVVRTDVTLCAAGPTQSYALEHVRHLAAGFGETVEPAAPPPPGFDAAYRVRDAYRLDETAVWSAMPAWLARCGVVRVPLDDAVVLHRDGSGSVAGRDVAHVVLADDAAVVRLCRAREINAVARRVPMTAFRTEPVPALTDPVLLTAGGGFALAQAPGGALDLVARGAPADAAARAGRHLRDPGGVRLAAQSAFEALVPRDGAPVVGGLRQNRVSVMIGLGPQAVFLAPALARFVAGVPEPGERAWCEARRPGRDFSRSSVAEYLPALPEPAA